MELFIAYNLHDKEYPVLGIICPSVITLDTAWQSSKTLSNTSLAYLSEEANASTILKVAKQYSICLGDQARSLSRCTYKFGILSGDESALRIPVIKVHVSRLFPDVPHQLQSRRLDYPLTIFRSNYKGHRLPRHSGWRLGVLQERRRQSGWNKGDG